MIRKILAVAMLAIVIAISFHSISLINKSYLTVMRYIDNINFMIEDEDKQKLEAEVGNLVDYWDDIDRRLTHYVRHEQINDITKSMSRLVPLTNDGEYTELLAELSNISWQIRNIVETEKPTLSNIL